mmetsp:Transcript_6859/g.17138  ORF Transcript_6859/g.17138 Transcript_6859/m.17138 type:complete len:209 (+) Transcript_6859:1003-1629(+)
MRGRISLCPSMANSATATAHACRLARGVRNSRGVFAHQCRRPHTKNPRARPLCVPRALCREAGVSPTCDRRNSPAVAAPLLLATQRRAGSRAVDPRIHPPRRLLGAAPWGSGMPRAGWWESMPSRCAGHRRKPTKHCRGVAKRWGLLPKELRFWLRRPARPRWRRARPHQTRGPSDATNGPVPSAFCREEVISTTSRRWSEVDDGMTP